MSNALVERAEDANQTVAANVRAELSRQRWTGRKAASALGLTQAYLARRLSGETPLDPADLVSLSVLLDVPITRFFAGTPTAPHAGAAAANSGVGPTGLEPMTSTVEHQRFGDDWIAPVTRLDPTRSSDVDGLKTAVVTTLLGRAS